MARRLQEGGQHFYLNGIRFCVSGDPNTDYCRQMIHSAMLDLQKLKDRSDPSLEIIDHEVAPFYSVRRHFGQDEIFIYPDTFKEGVGERYVVSEKEEEEEREEYYIAHEVWYMDPPDGIGGSSSPYYNNDATQIGYLICLGGGWNPPYEFIECVIGENDDGTKLRNLVHPLSTRAMWDTEAAKGVTVYPFFWNSWKGQWALDDDFPTPPWEGLDSIIDGQMPEVLLCEVAGVEYWDIPCNFNEFINPYYSRDETEKHIHNWNTGQDCVMPYCKYAYNGYCAYLAEGYPGVCLRMTVPGVEYGDEEDDGNLDVPGTEHKYAAQFIECEGWYYDSISDCANCSPEPFRTVEEMVSCFHSISTGSGYHYCVDIWFHLYSNYDWYSYPSLATWSCAKDLDQYAFYYEYEDLYESEFSNIAQVGHAVTTTEENRYNWEQGINVNGVKYPLKAVNDTIEFTTRSAPDHPEENSEGVCLKYFPNGWVVATIQRYKLSWDIDNALACEERPGPEMWFVWINVNTEELYWDQTIEPPYYNPGVIDAADDDWFGGVFGNSTLCHFRKIPDAPLYKDKNGAEWPMLTAGQFRLVKKVFPKEKKSTIGPEETVIEH